MTASMLPLFGTPISERFEQFHADNPRVYATLLRLAHEWVDVFGHRKVGMKALFEVARWQISLATSDPDFKLNNNYTAYYARLLMREHPALDGLFDLRRSEADSWLDSRAS